MVVNLNHFITTVVSLMYCGSLGTYELGGVSLSISVYIFLWFNSLIKSNSIYFCKRAAKDYQYNRDCKCGWTCFGLRYAFSTSK